MNSEGETALHYCGRIKKAALHFPKEDAMIMKLLMEHGSDVMAQTEKVIGKPHVEKICFESRSV